MAQPPESLADVAHLHNLTSGLNEQRKKNEFCDVVLMVEGHTVPSHASILSAASPFFRRLIVGEQMTSPIPTGTNFPQQIELKMPLEMSSDKSLSLLLDLLDYIYTGKIVLDTSRLGLVVQMAEAFMLEGLSVLVRNYGEELLARDEEVEPSTATQLCRATLVSGIGGNVDLDQIVEAEENSAGSSITRRKRKATPRRLAVPRATTTSRRRVRKSDVANDLSMAAVIPGSKESTDHFNSDATTDSASATNEPSSSVKRKASSRRSVVPRTVTANSKCVRKSGVAGGDAEVARPGRGGRITKTVTLAPDGASGDPSSAIDDVSGDVAASGKLPRKPRRKPSQPGHGRSYRCRVKDCDFLSGDAKAILEHRMVHSANHTFVCITCNFMSGRWKKLLDHLLEAGHDEETRCSLCNHKASDPECLRRHLERHAEDPARPYFCDACEMRFVNPSLVAMHMIKHTKERPFVCTQCGRGFKWRHCLYSHMQMHKEKEHICDQCGFRTAYKFTLHMHLRIHSGETFPCQHCDYRATRKQLLDDHVAAKHSTDRRFQCEVCGLKFALRMAYRRHSMTHNVQENLRFCQQCSFKTLRNSRLKAHVLKMHGERPS